jgi:2-keto-4-pentenoate hydratase/2-oxohepta-3-ene-1,7-dioic acid hydratase in catechol pathway
MKLASFMRAGQRSYGAVVGNDIYDLGVRFDDRFPDLKSFIAGGSLVEAERVIASGLPDCTTFEISWLPVIPNPGKIICVGLNYRAHIGEMKRTAEYHPVIFIRCPASQTGHLQPMICPRESDSFDYEGELAAVIGKAGRRIPESVALDHVSGWSIYNDGSVRDFQKHTHQWSPGKNFPNSGAFGPWMVTSDEIADPYKLTLITRLNGVVMQRSGINLLIFPIEALIAYISTFIELVPGDVIVSGTPGGVGSARTPPVFMCDGDTVEIEITKIGTLRNPVIKESAD